MSREALSARYVLRYVYTILAVIVIAVTIVIRTLYVAQQDERQVHERIQFFHLESISESDELRREVQLLKALALAALEATAPAQDGAVGVSKAQISYAGISQSIYSRLERMSELEEQFDGSVSAATLERFLDRFERIDDELRQSGTAGPQTLLTVEVLGSTVEQYSRLHKIRANAALRELATRQSDRPRFLAVLFACLGFSLLAGAYLVWSLRSAIRRQKETETALAESQERLHHVQKLDALGRLIGGVAHDFNNWLTVILGHTELLQDKASGDARLEAGLGEIKQAGLQAATLTQQLLAFSRRQELQPKLVNLNDEIASMEPMLRRIIGEDIALRVTYADDPHTVEVDPAQLQQVVMNLISNAREAMPGGGELLVRTDNIIVGSGGIVVNGVPEGRYLRLTVADNGTGMDAETQERIFEPFFTTKGEGRGTGLGLSTAHGVVTGSGGHIDFDSVEGSGTRFHIYLPRARGKAGESAAGIDSNVSSGGNETVLVVEDDEHVRRFVETGLSSLGYLTLTASGGAGALDICKDRSVNIDVILSDVIMPGVSGPRFMEEALKLRPDAVPIYMSAYTREEVLRFRRYQAADIPLISKPFSLDELSRLIRKQLANAAG